MIYDIKKHLLEEGIVDHVKNNFGKYGLAAAGLAAAGAGEFGDAAEGLTHSAANAVHSAGESLANMGHRTMDHYSGTPETAHTETAHTGTETAHTGTETEPHEQTHKEYLAQEEKDKAAKALSAKLNAPRSNTDRSITGLWDKTTSIDTSGNISTDRNITKAGGYAAAAGGLGLAGLGLVGAHKRDNRRMRDAYNNGRNSK